MINQKRIIATVLVASIMLAFVAACDMSNLEGSTLSRAINDSSLKGTEPATSGTQSTGGASNGTQSTGGASNGTQSTSGTTETQGTNGNDDGSPPILDLDPDYPPLTGPPAISNVLSPVASGTKTESNDKAVIDYSHADDGYVMIKWTGGAVAKGLRVQVIGPTGITYTYTLKADGAFEVYPLSDGNGTYTVRAVNLLSDGRGTVALSADIKVVLHDEFTPFLRPNQYVNFNEQSKVVKKAAELVSAQANFIEKISAIYSYVINSFTYDTDLANEIIAGQHPNYLPVLDTVYDKRKGICFDFAAVMAAMLRSQGIPTKLVVGNVNGDLRHAWLNVYSDKEGWIDAVIFFDGVNWELMDPTFASAGNNAALRDFIGDGSNYVELYLY